MQMNIESKIFFQKYSMQLYNWKMKVTEKCNYKKKLI